MIDLRCKELSPSGLVCNLPIGHALGRHAHMEWDEEKAEEVESWPTSGQRKSPSKEGP